MRVPSNRLNRRVAWAALTLTFSCFPNIDALRQVDDSAQPDASVDAGPDDRVLYVSQAAGSDVNDGRSTARPFASLKAALDAAQTQGLDGWEIRVCGGTYRERGLLLARSISIRGKYRGDDTEHGARVG